jgi:NADPH2:quinone reductase
VLRVTELPEPEPAPGEVRVKIVASGVNPTDWRLRSAAPGREMPFPFQVPNQDGAGVIDKVGAGVDAARVGERVWLYFAAHRRQYGSAEEYVCVPESLAQPLPADASFELGASLGVPALTAHYALFCDGPLDRKWVLVQGGAGAVGHFAIELAHWRGVRVITTVSSAEKAELARSAGADVVINYRSEDVKQALRRVAPDGVDRILEVAPENLELDLDLVADNSTIVFYASSETNPVMPVRRLMTTNVTFKFMLLYGIDTGALERATRDVNDALAAHALSELPITRFSLEDIVAAHEAVENHALGKVIIDLRQG